MPEIAAENGFKEFYERNYKTVYHICFTYMKNKSEAEDCTEDVFVKVLTGNFTFNDETHEKKWLTVTAINLCKDRLKHWFRRMVSPIEDAGEIESDPPAEPDETLEIVKKLPTKYKDVIYLHYYMDYKTAFFTGSYRTDRPAACGLHLYCGSWCDTLFAGECAG